MMSDAPPSWNATIEPPDSVWQRLTASDSVWQRQFKEPEPNGLNAFNSLCIPQA